MTGTSPIPRRRPARRARGSDVGKAMRPIDPAVGASLRTPFVRIGGRPVVERIVEEFYDRIEVDPVLRDMFPEDLEEARAKQRAFLEEWLGGEPRYSSAHGHPMLRRRHLPFAIGRREAGRWLRLMTEALNACEVDPELTAEILQRLGPLAHHMVNQDQDVPR